MVWDWEGVSIPRHHVVHQHGAHLALNGAHCGAVCGEALCRLLDRLLSELLDEGLRLAIFNQTFEVAKPSHSSMTFASSCPTRL